MLSAPSRAALLVVSAAVNPVTVAGTEPLLVTVMVSWGPEKLEGSLVRVSRVKVLPSLLVDPEGEVIITLRLPAVMVCWAFGESWKVAPAPVPMSARAATPRAPTVRTLREYRSEERRVGNAREAL